MFFFFNLPFCFCFLFFSSSLTDGVQDIEVVDMCLRALKALASYHYKETGSGKVGLGSQATGYKDPDGRLQEGILSRFLRLLLQFLLFVDYRCNGRFMIIDDIQQTF